MKIFLVLSMYCAAFYSNAWAMESSKEVSGSICLLEEYDTIPCAMTSVTTAQEDTYLVVGFEDGAIQICRPDGSDSVWMDHDGEKVTSLHAITTARGETYIISATTKKLQDAIKIWNIRGELIKSFNSYGLADSIACVETIDHKVLIIVGSTLCIHIYNFDGSLQKRFENFNENNVRTSYCLTALTTSKGETLIFNCLSEQVIEVRKLDCSLYKKLSLFPMPRLIGLHAFNDKDGNTCLIMGAKQHVFKKWNIDDDSVVAMHFDPEEHMKAFSFAQARLHNFHAPCESLLISFNDKIGFASFDNALDPSVDDSFDDKIEVIFGSNILDGIAQEYPLAECWSMKTFSTPAGKTFMALSIVKDPSKGDDSLLVVDQVLFFPNNKE